MALLAVIAVNAAVQFKHFFAAGHLVQTINILRDNGRELSGGFQLRQLAVGCIGTGCKTDHLLPVEIVKLRRVADKKAVAEDGFRWVIKFLIVKAIDRTEIGNAAFGRDTGTAEKDYAMVLINHLLEFLDILIHKGTSFGK